jgi:Domain of unknown function (DUF1814).
VRLAKSEYHELFVLKGGILLSKYIEIGRETTDLDFLARKISNDVSVLKTIFEKSQASTSKMGFNLERLK